MATATNASLTSRELSDVVDLLTASSTTQQQDFVLTKPREALRQSQADYVHQWDPRMSASGNRIAKQLAMLLDCLGKMNTWLRYKGRAELQAIDREPPTSGFVKLEQEASLVSEATADFLKELKLRQHESCSHTLGRRRSDLQHSLLILRHTLRLQAVGLRSSTTANERQSRTAVSLYRNQPAQWSRVSFPRTS